MTKRIRAGVIGLGVGESHVAAYHSCEDVEVVAICDLNRELLTRIGDRYEIGERYTDSRKITEHPNIDVISVCSYDDAHADQTISAFQNGKHVMVEKPVALYREESERVLRAQQDSGKFITSNLILRQSPRFQRLKTMINAGEFGDIFCIEGDYVHDILWKITTGWRGKMPFYCTVYGGGIHLIDLMRWLVGEEVTEVCGMGTDVLTRGSGYRRDDSFINVLRFEGGTIGKSFTTFGPRRTKFHALNVYGTKRTFINDMPNAKMFDGDLPDCEVAVTTPYPGMEKGDLLPKFIGAIKSERVPEVSPLDVFRVMDICFAAWDAARTGQTVRVNYLI